MTPKYEAVTIAIAQDTEGRHYFVSVDGARFRPVPHFPVGSTQAFLLFERQARRERNRSELERAYRGGITFMQAVG